LSAERRAHKELRRFASLALALSIVSILVGFTYLAQGDLLTRGAEQAPSDDQANKVGPGFRVYILEELSRTVTANKTVLAYSIESLPFDLTTLSFGDFQNGPQAGVTYYAGSGMLLNVSGPRGNIVLKEPSGKTIRELSYQGQASIVFNGETITTSFPRASTDYEGTDVLIQDWLKGTWSPDKGVVVEHPSGLTVERSEFYLMVYQAPTTVPEFGTLPAVALVVVILFVCSARRKKLP